MGKRFFYIWNREHRISRNGFYILTFTLPVIQYFLQESQQITEIILHDSYAIISMCMLLYDFTIQQYPIPITDSSAEQVYLYAIIFILKTKLDRSGIPKL